MNAALFWKEYRQQRALWLTVLLLAGLLVASFVVTLVRQDSVRMAVTYSLMSLSIAYGVAAGALLLAGEKEDGTLDFLDSLTGRRSSVWRRKLVAGAALTLSQCLALAVLALVMGFGSFENALIMVAIGLNAMAWGMLAGSQCRTVLAAVLAGIALLALNLILSFPFVAGLSILAIDEAPDEAPFLSAQAGLVLFAFYLSWRSFCRNDILRQAAHARPIGRLAKVRLSSWGVVMRLAWRQGRTALAAVVAIALLLGVIAGYGDMQLIVWPAGSLLLGLTCGLAVFVPDQNGGKQFLAAERFPLGRYWTVKTGFWLLALTIATALAWLVAVVLSFGVLGAAQYLCKLGEPQFWFSKWTHCLDQNADDAELLIIVWPLYGFCFGNFFGLIANRSIAAVFLATVFATVIVAPWGLSLLIGGVPAWWIFIVPIVLLLTAQRAMRAWASGRLLIRGPMIQIASATAFIAICLPAFAWRRATEVPDVGEPFDVKAYIATLPPPERNEAGMLIRHAIASLKLHREKLDEQLKWPNDPNSLVNIAAWRAYNNGLEKGWTNENKQINDWLDQMFKGEWAADIQKACRLPLGTLQDPRLLNSAASIEQLRDDCVKIVRLLVARGLQLQARGDSASGLDHLQVALALSRQLKNNAVLPQLMFAEAIETQALTGYGHWLKKAGANEGLLRAGLDVLQRHEAANPSLANNIKAEYLVARDNPHSFGMGFALSGPDSPSQDLARLLLGAAFEIPWERERYDRVVRAIFAAQIGIADEPYWKSRERAFNDRSTWFAVQLGFPLRSGPGAALDVHQWGELLIQTHANLFLANEWFRMSLARVQRLLNATQIVSAVSLYQAKRGAAPTRLDDLIPDYLANLPVDAVSGHSFDYRVSEGEEIDFHSGDRLLILASGQAVVFTGTWGKWDSIFYVIVPMVVK